MNPSLSATEFQTAELTPFVSFERMGEIVRQNRLYADKALGLSGVHFRAVATAMSMQNAEEAINQLVRDVKEAEKPKEAKQSIADAKRMAKGSESPHELHYLASMFINHPEVIREIAKNPHLDEKTQRVILNDPSLGRDRHVLRALGDNPALKPELMRQILNTSEDTIALQATARNAARMAQQSTGADTPYVKICDELADTTFDPAMRLIALAGARDAGVLRKIARTRDSVFAARELEAVADNSFTPKDVLVEMAGTSGPKQTIEAVFGVTIGQRAARTLAKLAHPEMDADAVNSL